MQESSVFDTEQFPALFRAFSRKAASNVQQQNLLTYRDIESESFKMFIKSNILKYASVEK